MRTRFLGGVHPTSHKESTRRKPIVPLEEPPKEVVIPLVMCAEGGAEPVVKKGDLLSIDGTAGTVILGAVPLKDPELSDEYQAVLGWADEVRTLSVRANADTPEDARRRAASARRVSA